MLMTVVWCVSVQGATRPERVGKTGRIGNIQERQQAERIPTGGCQLAGVQLLLQVTDRLCCILIPRLVCHVRCNGYDNAGLEICGILDAKVILR